MQTPKKGFFLRHKFLTFLLLLLLFLLWFHWPRPLLTGLTLREAQNDSKTHIRVDRHINGEYADVTGQIDLDALIDRLAHTRTVRFIGSIYGTSYSGFASYYVINLYLPGRCIRLPLGENDPEYGLDTMNQAYLSDEYLLGIHWQVLDYQDVIAFLDNMLTSKD